MVTYTTLTSSNYWHAVRTNIRNFLRDKLQGIQVNIESTDPDITSGGFLASLPYIVLPDSSISDDSEFLDGDEQFEFVIEGTIYHAYDKLPDNSLRRIKQAFLDLKLKTNRQTLAPYGMQDFKVEFDAVDPSGDIINQKRVIAVDYTITIKSILNIGV